MIVMDGLGASLWGETIHSICKYTTGNSSIGTVIVLLWWWWWWWWCYWYSLLVQLVILLIQHWPSQTPWGCLSAPCLGACQTVNLSVFSPAHESHEVYALPLSSMPCGHSEDLCVVCVCVCMCVCGCEGEAERERREGKRSLSSPFHFAWVCVWRGEGWLTKSTSHMILFLAVLTA